MSEKANVLTLDDLQKAVQSAAAIRYRARLQPAGGPGDKVFPPTYEGGQYALETRVIDGQRVPCVHLDSVQSQANRMELALLEAVRAKQITLPLVEVDFAAKGDDLKEVGVITSLEAPHRLADAILRDSGKDGKSFREMPEGKVLNEASLQNATGLFEISPTSLLFGLWDSTGPKGGLGVKFQRAIVSELVGVEIEKGAKTASRVDPLQIVKDAADIYKKKGGGWTLLVAEAEQEKGKPVLYGKKGEGKPSDINHGNVTPSMNDKEKKPLHGGVSFNYALQIAVLSLPALRRLHFPVASGNPDLLAQTTLAALGLCAATLSITKGCDLRSRCLLVPEAPAVWEIVGADGSTAAFSLSADQACSLLGEAVAAAKAAKLPWREEPLKLEPSAGLVELVRKSRALAMKTSGEE